MVVLYEKTATTSDWGTGGNNGLCILSPSSCIVTEVAGGEYELELEHPMDEVGKYKFLSEERLIKAPVPKMDIPQTQMPPYEKWEISEQTNLYSRTPSKTMSKTDWDKIQKVKDNPTAYGWFATKMYSVGALCLYSNSVYEVQAGRNPGVVLNQNPYNNPAYWTYLGQLDAAEPAVSSGTIIDTLAVGTRIFKIADAKGYMRVRTLTGKIGFVDKNCCTNLGETESRVIDAQTITDQVFRIYEVTCDEETHTYTVKARHISYDFMGNSLFDCKVTDADANDAISWIQAALVEDDSRTIACNITGDKITEDWSFKNPINALLDPDSGLVSKFNARLVRNNDAFYILDNNTPRQGITIEYGVNMLGVNWTRSIENVVTRIIPRSGSSDKGYLYISNGGRILNGEVQDQGKNYVESELADQYAVKRISILNCSYNKGQKYEKPDGTTATYSEQDVLDKMLTDAKEQFTVKHADGVDIKLEVEFLLLGDTEEYKQYKGLQVVNLYDQIKVKTERSNIVATAQVTEYEYDCLRGRYNSIKLGTVNSFNKRIAGYRVVNGSISYDKLSADLINRIVTANASASSDNSIPSGNAGTGEFVVYPNTVSTDGVVTKGQGQASKVWKTDADGNPSWRDESGVTVNDSDPTLSWGTRSKIGDVAGTDLHVTMPSDPSPYAGKVSLSFTNGVATFTHNKGITNKNYTVAIIPESNILITKINVFTENSCSVTAIDVSGAGSASPSFGQLNGTIACRYIIQRH